MNTKYQNKISNNLKFSNIKTVNNSAFFNKEQSLNGSIEVRGSIAQNLEKSIEHLKRKSFNLSFFSYDLEGLKTNIKNKKLTESKIKTNASQKVSQPSSFYNTIIAFSSILKGMVLTSSKSNLKNFNPKAFSIDDANLQASETLGPEFKYAPSPKMERNGLFMTLNSAKDFFYCLNNALISLNKGGGKGRLNTFIHSSDATLIKDNNKLNLYKIRHYLNLITKFDFNLATSYYDYFQFTKSNKYLFKMQKAAELLKIAFLTKGCLISKPIFNIVYPQNSILNEEKELNLLNYKDNNSKKTKIIIHLFYYVKTRRLVNKTSTSLILPSNLIEAKTSQNTNSLVVPSTTLESVSLNIKTGNGFMDQVENKYITTIFDDKFNYLCDYLTKLFNAEIEFELIRLYRPYQDSNILVQYLNSQSYNRKFIRIISILFKRMNTYKKIKFNIPSINGVKANIADDNTLLKEAVAFPSGVSGVNLKLAGRPMKEKVIPRFTVKRAQRGNFDRLNTKMIEKSMFTDKNKKGAFNFTVRLSHIFR